MSKYRNPVVSIACVTYNHEEYISQAIESFLAQKTNFVFEIVIGEDYSTDATRTICQEYATKYPDIIKLIISNSNIGAAKNGIRIFEACKGKYIALCDGDDYWTDPFKLQKQVDFLESNKDYSIASHRYRIFDNEKKTFSLDFAHDLFDDNIDGLEFDKYKFLEHQYTQTLTVVLRREMLDLPLFLKLQQGDMALFYCCLKNGPGYCFNFDGAVYRRHLGGIYSKRNDYEKVRAGFYLFYTLYFKTPDKEIFKKYLEYHRSILFGKIKENILNRVNNSYFLKDVYTVLMIDIYTYQFFTFIKRLRKLVYWSLKSNIKK